jgi:hypothetical protein
MRTYRGPFCRDCGSAVYKKAQGKTLVTGWWGIIAFFINCVFIVQNLVSRSKINRLPKPVGAPVALRRYP